MTDFNVTTCDRGGFCYSCDEISCGHHGQKIADCPKYHCDNPNGFEDCDHCEFINDYIEQELRKAPKDQAVITCDRLVTDVYYSRVVDISDDSVKKIADAVVARLKED